jgi:hypothetical protein
VTEEVFREQGGFLVGNLTTLAVSTPYSVDDRFVNQCTSVGGMRIGRGNLDRCHGISHESHRTLPGIKPRLQRWDDGN